jgi:hypothetical protein
MMLNIYAAPMRVRPIFVVLSLIAVASVLEAKAQVEVEIGALAYIDYYYTLSSPVEEDDGLHGFTYRRLYLTTDFRLSEDFKGRARLEANDGTTGSKGPVPFVKDLYLTWNYAGDHSVTMGVAPPPAFEVTERIWSYRSLEKPILDFQGINDSRDFGIRINGPLVRGIRYGAMVANNNAAKPETDPYKRGYVQLEFYPTDHLTFTLGADHAGFGEDGPVSGSTRLSVMAGYVGDRFAVGAEPYMYVETAVVGDDFESIGISLFGRVRFSPKWELVARTDRIREEQTSDRTESFTLLGLAFRPNENVRIIPNLWFLDKNAIDEAEALARLTVDVSF